MGYQGLIIFVIFLLSINAKKISCQDKDWTSVLLSVNATPFGYPTKEKFFLIPKSTIQINHGSFGATPIPILQQQLKYMEEMEHNTGRWFSYTVRPRARNTIADIARYVNANEEDVVLVENASNAVNAVIRSIKFKSTDKVLQFNIAYGMLKETLLFAQSFYNFTIITINLEFPTTESDIINKFKNALDQNPEVKFAAFDHISSTPAIIFPIKQLVEECRKRNVLHIIDGAHSLGQVPIDIKSIDPDFYLSNAHKWLCAPKGAAFLFIRKSAQSFMHPTVISFGYNKGIQEEFMWVGTRDFSAYLAISDSIAWRKAYTDSAVFKYNNDLCVQASDLLVKLWKTDTLVPRNMTASLTNIVVPCNSNNQTLCYTWDLGVVAGQLVDKFDIWVPLFEVSPNGKRVVRISCQIYNDITDYEKLGKAIIELTNPI